MSNSVLARAVHTHSPLTRRGVLERLFTRSFQGLVCTQIWEDPAVDLAALRVEPTTRIVTIASAGCNVLNYLTADPARVIAVDLNPAHLALTRLKLAALAHLPSYGHFFRFFGHAASTANPRAYRLYLRDRLDADSRAYWDGRSGLQGPRIDRFADNFYRHGTLGHFLSALQLLARLHGVNTADLLRASSLDQQRRFFDERLAPLLDRPLLRRILGVPLFFGPMGVPPAQFDRLHAEGQGDMLELYRSRVRRLACDHPVRDNYFAWQAFALRYDRQHRRAVPPYLRPEAYDLIRERAHRVETQPGTITAYLSSQPKRSLDRFVLLDAQDWMSGEQIARLWREIGRTARPGARVVFRTIAAEPPIELDLPLALRAPWRYLREEGEALLGRDRTGVYGGFHVYELAA